MTNQKRGRLGLSRRHDKAGNHIDGLVLTTARGYVLISRAEWVELRERGDRILGIDTRAGTQAGHKPV